jgi:hypothetical protein
MTETPEEVREKVFQAELAKGSDPRVAEGRAKAAEMRALHGLPIDPQEAWKAKLAGDGKTPTPPPAPVPEAPPPAAQPEPEPPAPAEEAALAPEPPESTEETPASEPATSAPATPPPPAQPEPTFEPEVGEIIELDVEGLKEIAGVKLRERRPAPWLVVVLLAIVVWAAFYLIAFGNNNTPIPTTNCHVQATKTLICPRPSP